MVLKVNSINKILKLPLIIKSGSSDIL